LETTGQNIRLNKLKAITKPRLKYLSDGIDTSQLWEVEAGNIIQDLNDFLWKHNQTLLNQPGYEHLNYIGVSTSGGHGSGLRIGPIAQAILSIQLLTLGKDNSVQEYRIEPNNGIANPEKYKEEGSVLLIQDDDIFNSVLVSVGCMGIITSVIIKTQENFYLQEKRTLEVWEESKEEIHKKIIDPNIHSIHVWFNPYQVKNKTYCVLSEYNIVDGPEDKKRPAGMRWNLVDDLAPLLLNLMKAHKDKIPEIINASLRATVNKKPVVMKNPEALNFGSPNYSPVHATNFSVPFDQYREFLNAMVKMCAKRSNKNAYVTSPIGFRFTSPGRGLISPQYEQKSCMVEVPLILGTDHAKETIAQFHALAFKKYDGRPHWGQLNEVLNAKAFKQMFPEWKTFIKNYAKFNKGHFDNELTEQLQWRKLVNEI